VTVATETDRIWGPIEGYLAAEDIELDDLEIGGAAGSRLVRVIVDAEGGIDVERIAAIATGIGRLLDDGLISDNYSLEVTSPGLERALRRPAQYQKSIGREVQITTNSDIDGSTDHRGVLRSITDEDLAVEVDGDERIIPFSAVNKARTVFTWEKGKKPGGKKR
jgi:ribosome maturation factor RimP